MVDQPYRTNPTSGVVGEAWELYKAHWRHFLAISFLVYLGMAALTALATAALTWVGAIVGLLLSVVGSFWVQGALVKAVEDVRDGRADLSVSETLAGVWPRLGSIIVAGLLAGIGIAIGFIFLIVPGLVLWTWWILVIPVVVLERSSAIDAFGRSRELVRGHGLAVFGVIVVTILVLIVAGIVIGLLLLPLADWLRSFVSNVISGALTAPFIAAAWTVLYYRLRDAHGEAAAPAAPVLGEPGSGAFTPPPAEPPA